MMVILSEKGTNSRAQNKEENADSSHIYSLR